jgi:hypothetical protein
MTRDNSKEQKCGYNNFRRVRYFHGMLMTDSDFSEEQSYHNRKRKLLNRMLHGTGVVCGLKMKPTGCGKSSKIIISPGLALDCAGNEIFIPDECELDVIKMIKSVPGFEAEPKKAACEPVESEEEKENKWYVVVRYQEVHNAPVPVYAPAGGCEEKVCEYSRIKEGYCFEVLRDIPESVKCPVPTKEENGICSKYTKQTERGTEIDASKSEDIRKFLCEDLLMPCPDICCDNQPVVLGSIDFTNKDITPETTIDKNMINNWDCRTYVITFGLLQYWMKQFEPTKLSFDSMMNYAYMKDVCQNDESEERAFEFFKKMCNAGKGTSDEESCNPDE